MADEEQRVSLTHLYRSLEKPVWLINAGLSKGIYHDRYTVGAILPAGTTLRFRQSIPDSSSGVILRLMNDDSKTEVQSEVTANWNEIVSIVPSVPFFSTPYTERAGELIGIEVEIVGGWKILPIYKPGVNADLFFQGWDSREAEYALIDSVYAKILVPAKDKNTLKTLHRESGLQSLIAYYNGIFEYFNYLAGLSFDPVAATDKNIPNRFFIKADKSGAGAAYYGHGWTAESSDSVASFWLNINGANWGSIHEIGHGYQGTFMAYSTAHLGEVWNNLLASNYQKKVLGEDYYKVGWLYAGGEENLYAYAREHFDSGLVGGSLGLILFFLLLVFGCSGEQGIIEFFQRYRRLSNTAGFKAENYPAMDLLSTVAIDVANADVSSFMSFAKISLTPRQLVENAYKNAQLFYPLYLLIPESDLNQVQTLLGLRGPLDLVSCTQLAVTGLKRSKSFGFDSYMYPEIAGKSFMLRDGKGPARIVKITKMLMTVHDLPVGNYALQLPSPDDGSYQPVSHYVAVKDDYPNFSCVYEKKIASDLADQVVFLGGLYGVFCKLGVKISCGQLFVDILRESPHSGFSGQVYAEVTIKDVQGSVVYSRSMQGDKTELASSQISIADNFVIEIMHMEPSRMAASNSSASPVIDGIEKINRLKVTAQGLINIGLGTDAGENLKAEIEKCAATFESLPHLALYDDYPVKHSLRWAINTFADPVRSQLFERYRTVEFAPPMNDRVAVGGRFTWHLQGNGGRAVGYIIIDLWARKVDIEFYAVNPHEYFSSIYVSVVMKSALGEVLYLYDLRGDVLAEATHVQLPLVLGSAVSVMHREPGRCWIVNEDFQKVLPVGRVQHVSYNALAGLNFASYWPTINNESLIEE